MKTMGDDQNRSLNTEKKERLLSITNLKETFQKSKKFLVFGIVLIIFTVSVFVIRDYIKNKDQEVQKNEEKLPGDFNEIIYHDLDEMIVNLDTGGKGTTFLKVNITLAVRDKESLAVVKKLTPKIRDTFFMFFRQLRPQDLQSSVSLYRLREALLKRVNKIVYPAEVTDLLFKDILMQ